MARWFCVLAACNSVPSTVLNPGLSVIESLRTFCGGAVLFTSLGHSFLTGVLKGSWNWWLLMLGAAGSLIWEHDSEKDLERVWCGFPHHNLSQE